MNKLLLATNNKDKVREYKRLLQGIPYEIVTLAEQGITTDVDEVGKSLEEAKDELIKKKLSIAQKGVQFSSRWEKGKIVHQDPSPGSRIKINKVVKIILSAGSEKVKVPRLVGRNLQSIGEILSDAGLRKGKISQVHTSRYAAGKIIAQHPLASEEV